MLIKMFVWFDDGKSRLFFQIIRQYFSVIFALFKGVANGVDQRD
jgi:hypothetical protein